MVVFCHQTWLGRDRNALWFSGSAIKKRRHIMKLVYSYSWY